MSVHTQHSVATPTSIPNLPNIVVPHGFTEKKTPDGVYYTDFARQVIVGARDVADSDGPRREVRVSRKFNLPTRLDVQQAHKHFLGSNPALYLLTATNSARVFLILYIPNASPEEIAVWSEMNEEALSVLDNVHAPCGVPVTGFIGSHVPKGWEKGPSHNHMLRFFRKRIVVSVTEQITDGTRRRVVGVSELNKEIPDQATCEDAVRAFLPDSDCTGEIEYSEIGLFDGSRRLANFVRARKAAN